MGTNHWVIIVCSLVGAICALFLGVAMSRMTGWRWHEEDSNPFQLSDEQKKHMAEVHQRNLDGILAELQGARRVPPRPIIQRESSGTTEY